MKCQFTADVKQKDSVLYKKGEISEVSLSKQVSDNPMQSFIYFDDSKSFVATTFLSMVGPYDIDLIDELIDLTKKVESSPRILFIHRDTGLIRSTDWIGENYYFFPDETFYSGYRGLNKILRAKRILMADFVRKAAEEAGIPIYEISYDRRYPTYYHLFKNEKHVYLGDTIEESVDYFANYSV